MLSIKYIRQNEDIVMQSLKSKKSEIDLSIILNLDKQRRDIIQEADLMKANRNTVSELIATKCTLP